jgi:hypothetical protein
MKAKIAKKELEDLSSTITDSIDMVGEMHSEQEDYLKKALERLEDLQEKKVLVIKSSLMSFTATLEEYNEVYQCMSVFAHSWKIV